MYSFFCFFKNLFSIVMGTKYLSPFPHKSLLRLIQCLLMCEMKLWLS